MSRAQLARSSAKRGPCRARTAAHTLVPPVLGGGIRTARGLAVALAIALVLGVAQVPAHHHPDLAPAPWTSSRPHSKSKHQPRDKRVRRVFHWPSPCYLDTAPVIFPGPGAQLRPPFGDTKEPPFKVR